MNKTAFVLLAMAVTACAPPPVDTPRSGGATPGPADGARIVHAIGAYSIRIPASVRQVPVQGIDSAVDQFEGPSFSIMLDYGRYSCGLPDPHPGQTNETAQIDGRTATIIRYRDGYGERPIKLTANFVALGASGSQQPLCLSAHAQCVDDRSCDAARDIFNTIDFD